jgi:TPR repeat protein
VKPDTGRARHMYQYAAFYFGDADGQYHLARMMLDQGPFHDPKQAARWLHSAANKGQYQAQALLEGGLAEELALRREELRPELDARLKHLEGCLHKLPDEQRSLVEGYYHRRDGIEKLAESSGRTVAATYKTLQRVRQALQLCIENATKPEGMAP